MGCLDGKVAVITGAGNGIGKSHFVDQGRAGLRQPEATHPRDKQQGEKTLVLHPLDPSGLLHLGDRR